MKWVDRIYPPRRLVLANGKTILEKRSRTPFILVALIVAGYISVELTGFDIHMLARRWREFFVIIGQMIPPDWLYMQHLWDALIDTIKMSLLGSLLGSLAAVPVAMLAAGNVTRSRLISAAAKIGLSLLRTLPTLVSALVATFIFGLGTLAGTVAIFLFTLAYVGKLLYEQIENADMGPFEAMESLGMTRVQAFRHAIMPQVVASYLSTSLFCFEGNVRYAAILGYVGAGGIGLLLNQGLSWRNYPRVGIIILMLVITVFIIERISEHYRKKLT